MGEVTEADIRGMARQLVDDLPPDEVDQYRFRGAQFDRGLAYVQFPEGHGGLGLDSRKLQTVVDAELRGAGVPYHDLAINPIGIGMGAPVVLTYASEEQKKRLLRPMYTGEEIWCQLFSEPGAGSDVAGLSTRAVRDGDEWVVNGQKVWTTLAHVSKWGMLVARTDPDQPKHKGMTYFLLDMESPGVDVRPLHQITGEAEFNEVFFDDVRIPHDRVFGDVGAGWNAAVTTLMNERVALGGGVPKRGTGPIRDLVQVWDENKETLDPVVRTVLRDRVSALWSEAEALRLTNVFPAGFVDTVEVGEQSGRLSESMEHLSANYRDQARAALATISVLASMAIWALVGLFIIVLILRLMMFYVGMINGLIDGI